MRMRMILVLLLIGFALSSFGQEYKKGDLKKIDKAKGLYKEALFQEALDELVPLLEKYPGDSMLNLRVIKYQINRHKSSAIPTNAAMDEASLDKVAAKRKGYFKELIDQFKTTHLLGYTTKHYCKMLGQLKYLGQETSFKHPEDKTYNEVYEEDLAAVSVGCN